MNPLVKAIDANLRVLELQAENERLRAALQEVQWVGEFRACPWCLGSEKYGHRDACQRQAALSPAEQADDEKGVKG